MTRRLLGAAAVLIFIAPSVSHAETVGVWTVNETVSPLTNAKTISASTPSTSPLLNMLSRPEPAQLVLRCSEGVRAAYVSWPEVLTAPFRSALLSLPETMVLKKLDDGAITTDFWVVSDDRTAAGAFDNLGAPKIMASLHGAKRLVVRMTGQTKQDAVFDLTGVDDVINRVEATCGGGKVAAILPAVVESPSVSSPAGGNSAGLLQAAAAALTQEGFTNVQVTGSQVSAPLQPFKLTTRQADCGRSFGIPYLLDSRSHTQVAPAVTLEAGRLTVKLTVAGLMKVGVGAPDKPLKCTSTGVLEQVVLEKVIAAADVPLSPPLPSP